MTKAKKILKPQGGGTNHDNERPYVFHYHDYRKFLKDWFVWNKTHGKEIHSMRSIARNAEIASGTLPMVLSGKRPLSHNVLQKVIPHLGLNPIEKKHFLCLWEIGESENPQVRIEALERLQKSAPYQKENPAEVEAYRYLSNWINVAIHEMALMNSTELNAEKIQSSLMFPTSLSDVKSSLQFLIDNQFVIQNSNNTWSVKKKNLECLEGIFKISLGSFHKQIFELASKSIETCPREIRDIQGHSFPIKSSDFAKIREILNEALIKIKNLESKPGEGEVVYHVEMAAFPLTKEKS